MIHLNKSVSMLLSLFLCTPLVLLSACTEEEVEFEPAKSESKNTQHTASATPETVTLNYKIDGMTCNGCRSKVERSVADIKGVESLDVSLEEGSATVRVSDRTINDEIIRAVQEKNFTITLDVEDDDPATTG